MSHVMEKKKVKYLLNSSTTHLHLSIMPRWYFHVTQGVSTVFGELGALAILCPNAILYYLL